MKKRTLSTPAPLYGVVIALAIWGLSFTPAHGYSIMPTIKPDTLVIKGIVQYVNDRTKTMDALPGTAIMIKGTRIGVASNENGNFQLRDASDRDSLTLVLSHVGFFIKEISVINRHSGNEENLGSIVMKIQPLKNDCTLLIHLPKGKKTDKKQH
ncbi:MAG: carboxypeptidase-like regulatory domain-containing protein [Chitinophaga sp.]|uniref:carboxypeptidase-like regulatory domain-containing protein n=1 Tax=Chitinophaga sp. TaxID=1869181 RepID=UPI001B12865A|nr:carboxypeptidase-like regulatory domain-containing protein [Chitinophaga sp.]MBO9732832.1 carboxypeptidase-like regulatory domain-containing protein [Chitinophaga sp.]